MGGDKDKVYRQTMHDAGRLRMELSRRRLLQIGAATAAMAAAGRIGGASAEETHGPGWYTDDKLTGEITIYTFSGQRWELPTLGVLPIFTERFPNVKVNVTAVPISEGITKGVMLASSHSPDLDALLVHAGEMAAVNNTGAQEPLQAYLDKDPGWLENYLAEVPADISKNYRIPQTHEGQLFAIPSDGNTHIMFYRSDLFQEANLSVPKTWDETIEVCKALHKPDKDQYGFICWARRGLYSALAFQQIFCTNGGRMFDAEEKGGWHPTLNNDKGRVALEVLTELMKYAHPVTLNAVDDEVNTALANGTAVFAPFTGGTTILNDEKFTKFHEVFASDLAPHAPVPGGDVNILAGFAMYVNAFSDNKQAAFEFVKHLTSGDYTDTRIGKALAVEFGQPVRLPLLEKYADIRPHFVGLKKSFELPQIPVIPLLPEGITLHEVIGNEVSAYLAGEKSMDDALKAMDDNVFQVMTDGGYYD